MAVITDITVSDGTTPVTFTHKAHTSDTLTMIDSTASVSESATKFVLARFTGKRGSPNVKYRLQTSMSYLETVSGGFEGYVAPPKIAFTNYAQTDYTFSKRASSAQRAYIKAIHMGTQQISGSAIAHAVQPVIHSAIVFDQFPY